MQAVANKRLETLPTENDLRWQAVSERDKSFDGQFVFAVSSTSIYCRPSCPSRRPRRDRVAFYESPATAEAAGFRACRRCHPKQEAEDARVTLVKRVCELIDADLEGHVSLEKLSKRVGLSSFHIQRAFKSEMGISPREYAAARKAQRFREGVKAGEKIMSAMYGAGYGSSSRLYETAGAELGMSPATYGRNGANTKINYAITHCGLGHLLVASTGKGVCSVRIGDDPMQLSAELHEEFSAANITRSDAELSELLNLIVNHIESKQTRLDVPLDIRSTAFQRQVWRALREIPLGETRSYSDIAHEIGRASAVRAVARACASNPVALVIPCHRVIREDKSLGGYRWGLERKKKLLERERAIADGD
jgi:AraC family transcriptional regulator, regulatory protein of adaptative response / methylated-DNA-[protein]-cysteine methyltransferase